MKNRGVAPNTVTITPVADGLAYVYGRVVADTASGRPSWEYLGNGDSRDDVVERARRAASGGNVRFEESDAAAGLDGTKGIAPTRPPADS